MDPSDPPFPDLGRTSLLDYVEDLGTFIRKLGPKPILMGHSMGGLLTQMLAAKGLAAKAILLAPAPPAGIHALSWSMFRSFSGMFFQWGFWRKPHRISFDMAVYAFLHQLPESEQKQEYENLVYESGRAAAEIGLWYLDPSCASRVDDTRVTCPVLIVAGGKDRIVPVGVARKILQKYREVAILKEFDRHCHWLMGGDDWEPVAACVLDWLEGGA
jgi:pimeloyl-ACP methyl ester carboxylesterase